MALKRDTAKRKGTRNQRSKRDASGIPPSNPADADDPVEYRPTFQGIANPKKRRFLAAFAHCGSVTVAAKQANVH